PGNYGMIPKTILPKKLGGDGDPLDVIVLGPPVNRGTVVKAKLIGVLKLLDNGEQDDKLIAVMTKTPFYNANSLNELDQQFNGVTRILETFFSNYKGPGQMKSLGLADEKEAKKVLKYAIEEYK
ncbi:MAG: inorganic diphosphatase, partial [Flavobacteriales bacterium]|nr:inorganic diphosphatase [Flavobacteriales bacterium]